MKAFTKFDKFDKFNVGVGNFTFLSIGGRPHPFWLKRLYTVYRLVYLSIQLFLLW